MESVYDNKTIFIQIASYRDPELPKTVIDCINQSKNPNRLRFGICRQFSLEDKDIDSISDFTFDYRFKIIEIDFAKSKGVCWARNKIQKLYENEDYTLQLDSHHRFLKNWDEQLINMLEDLKKDGYNKPLITTYASSYNPDNDPSERDMVPWQIDFDHFTPDGVVSLSPSYIDNWKKINKPLHARFYSAHMCFADGCFVSDVQHDPKLYFNGEEISIAARAYTHGYDLFHPHKVIIWHHYERKGYPKHWNDHKGQQGTNSWITTNKNSNIRYVQLFDIDGSKKTQTHFGKYGFGNIRTLQDFEKYTGLCFKTRSVQKYTIDKREPPNPLLLSYQEFEKSCSNYSHGIWKKL